MTNYTGIPVPELIKLMSSLTPPMPSSLEGVPFRRYLVLEKDGRVVIPSNSMFPVTEYHDHEVVDELEFRWNKQQEYWELYNTIV